MVPDKIENDHIAYVTNKEPDDKEEQSPLNITLKVKSQA